MIKNIHKEDSEIILLSFMASIKGNNEQYCLGLTILI